MIARVIEAVKRYPFGVLPPESEEFRAIARLFFKEPSELCDSTLSDLPRFHVRPDRTINAGYEVQSIQALWLPQALTMYEARKGLMLVPNERLLFHGFSKPGNLDQILRQGLDMRVGNEGCYFGKAIYASTSARYSDTSYTCTDSVTSCREILVLRCLVGRSKDLTALQSLQRPPEDPDTKQIYDSVNSYIGNTTIAFYVDLRLF
jgi:hypothetical protein